MSTPPQHPAQESSPQLLLRNFKVIFGPQQGAEWFAAGLTWEQAREKQREYFVATFGAEEGNHYADLNLPTLAAIQCANVKRNARIEVLKAQCAAKDAQRDLLKRMLRDARAADERMRTN